ncbi:MAG: hypothetical protein IID40_08450 [Planctomycetes bacterium]|nr:hypothetical protein [Planctomycetota bacterium]
MSPVNARIEQLIVRRLDGELTDDERLELDRALMRDPQARRLLQESERIDALAAAALTAVVEREGQDDTGGLSYVVPAAARPSYSRVWWAMPAAVAAALALGAILLPQRTETPDFVQVDPITIQPSEIEHRPRTLPVNHDAGLRQASYRSPGVERAVQQNLLYVVGDDGRIYVIDQQRIRTTRQPTRGTNLRQLSGDL